MTGAHIVSAYDQVQSMIKISMEMKSLSFEVEALASKLAGRKEALEQAKDDHFTMGESLKKYMANHLRPIGNTPARQYIEE